MALNTRPRFRLWQSFSVAVLTASAFQPALGWGADDEQPAQNASPSHNLLRRIGDDYEVIHGKGGLLPQRWRSAPAILVTGALIATDEATFRQMSRTYSGPTADFLTRSFNWLGSSGGVLLASGALLSQNHKGAREDGKLLLAAVVDANITVEVLKRLTGRERPYQSGGETVFHGPGFNFYSFPSGHAATSFAMAEVLGRQHPKQKHLYYALATVVALGRIHKNKHFLSDVVVGASLGLDSADRVLKNKAEILAWRF